jgi:ribosomal protein S18 acetylase RimI-like enzyme
LARCYQPGISPLSAIAEPSAAAFADLRELVAPEQKIALFATEPLTIPHGWSVIRSRCIDQMVCGGLRTRGAALPVVELTPADVPEMLTLTALTQPGPFLPETIRMGRYLGIKVDGRLAAMAGQRLRLNGFTEVSAVCTHPDYRGRGYASALTTPLIDQVLCEGRTPFLHVKTENAAAKRVYEKLGFSVRRPIHFAVLTPA